MTYGEVLNLARGEIGYRESPPGSNANKYGEWYGMNYAPWCAIFVTWCVVRAGHDAFAQGARYSYVPYIEADAKSGAHGLKALGKAAGEPGDVITFQFDADANADHVGFVEENLGGGDYQTIEGNTSTGNDSNGGEVMRRTRYASQVSMVVRYPAEPGAPAPPPKRPYYPIHHGPS